MSAIAWELPEDVRAYRAVAIQTHGAMGFTNEVGLHHAWHA